MLNLKISEYAKAGRTAYQAAIAQNTINHALMLADESKS